jgi:hypothetical protein
MRAMLSVLLVVGLVGSAGSYACEFDRDCSGGGKCLKDWNSFDGICFGGARPGNEGDRRPGPQRDPNHTRGNRCSSDFECGAGSECLKAPGEHDGVCDGR